MTEHIGQILFAGVDVSSLFVAQFRFLVAIIAKSISVFVYFVMYNSEEH